MVPLGLIIRHDLNPLEWAGGHACRDICDVLPIEAERVHRVGTLNNQVVRRWVGLEHGTDFHRRESRDREEEIILDFSHIHCQRGGLRSTQSEGRPPFSSSPGTGFLLAPMTIPRFLRPRHKA